MYDLTTGAGSFGPSPFPPVDLNPQLFMVTIPAGFVVEFTEAVNPGATTIPT